MTTILAGACGSGSGGLGIALSAMADKYISLGLAPEILHRWAPPPPLAWTVCPITAR